MKFWEDTKNWEFRRNRYIIICNVKPKRVFEEKHTERRKEIKNIKLRCVVDFVCVCMENRAIVFYTLSHTLPSLPLSLSLFSRKIWKKADMMLICYTTEIIVLTRFRSIQTRSVWRYFIFLWAFPSPKMENFHKFFFISLDGIKEKIWKRQKRLVWVEAFILKLIFPHFAFLVLFFCYFSWRWWMETALMVFFSLSLFFSIFFLFYFFIV